MGKQCFTCANKLSKELSAEEKKDIEIINLANNNPYKRIPEMIFNCKVSGERINQTDPACNDYESDKFMEDIRVEISKTARKLRKEL